MNEVAKGIIQADIIKTIAGILTMTIIIIVYWFIHLIKDWWNKRKR